MPAPDRVWLVNHDASRPALAREGDLPGWLAAVDPRYCVPHRAEVAVAAVVSVLVLAGPGVFAAGIAYRGWRLRSAAA